MRLTKHHAMKTYGGMLYAFLTSALDGDAWSSRSDRLTPGKEPPVPEGQEAGGPQSRCARGGRAGLHIVSVL